MKWPFALIVLLVPLMAFVQHRRKPAKKMRKFVAESSLAKTLPSFKKRARRAIWLQRIEVALLVIMLIFTGLLISRPQRSILKINEENSHDIVLCLDASGSMTKYIPDALKTLNSIVEKNRSDRYAIVVFQNASYTVLPLTRDTVAIRDRIKFLSDGYANPNDFNAVTRLGYDGNIDGGTDIGNGLIGCMKRFDNLAKEKSRSIIMLSDMEHNGTTNYLDIAQLIPKYKIRSFIMTPDYATEAVQASDYTAITSSKAYELGSNSGVSSVLGRIFNQILNVEISKNFIQTDNPHPYLIGLMATFLLYCIVVAKRWGSI